MTIHWTKEQRERAKREDKGLFAVGSDTKTYKWIQQGLMSHDLCNKLTVFASYLYKTKDPAEAFKTAWPDLSVSQGKSK